MTQEIIEAFKGLGLEDEEARERFRRMAGLDKLGRPHDEHRRTLYTGSTTSEPELEEGHAELESTR